MRFFIISLLMLAISLPCPQSSADIRETEQKLTVADGQANEFGGFSISGDYMVAGAPDDNDNASLSGSAYVFKLEGGAWTLQTKLTAPDGGGPAEHFGSPVAVSGEYLAIGALGKNPATIHMYKREGGTWLQQDKIPEPDPGSYDRFGETISLSGEYLVVGADGDSGSGWNAGAAYIYKQENGKWSQQAKLAASDASPWDKFGKSVSISGDYAVIGAWYDHSNYNLPYSDAGNAMGAAYIFKRENGTWAEQAKLTASDGVQSDGFGRTVDISGEYAVVGAGGAHAAYIFRRENGVWTQQAKLTGTDKDEPGTTGFGSGVSISGDFTGISGSVSPGYGHLSLVETAYIFRLENGDWSEYAWLTASDAKSSWGFGTPVISGEYAYVTGETGNSSPDSGSVYIYHLFDAGNPGVQCPVSLQPDLSFVISNAVYQSITGDESLSMGFKYLGNPNGAMLWALQDVTATAPGSCATILDPGLSFSLSHATVQTSSGSLEIWADFKFFDFQNNQFLWKLVDFGVK